MTSTNLTKEKVSRPTHRKIADWLLLVATMALTLMPFISFARVDYISDPNSFTLGGGFFHFFYRTIKAFFSLKDLTVSSDLHDMLFRYMGMIICGFFLIYSIVQMIISLCAIVFSIIRAVKGKTDEIASKTARLISGMMALGIFFTLFSTPYVSFRFSVLMQLTFLFALILIFASIVVSAIANREFVFRSKINVAHFIKDALFLLSGLCVFLLGMFLPFSDYVSAFLRSFDTLTSSSSATGFTPVYTLFAYMIILPLAMYLIIPTTDQVKGSILRLTHERHIASKYKLHIAAKCYTHPIAECVISGLIFILTIVNLIVGVGDLVFLGVSLVLAIFCFLTSVGTIACYIIGRKPKKQDSNN